MLLVLVGFSSLLAQVVLLREIGVTFYGSEIAYVLGLAVWLVAGACGAAWTRGRTVAFPSAGLLFAVTAPAALVLARDLRPILGIAPGADLGLDRLLLATMAVLAPTGALAGTLFRLAAARRPDAGRAAAGGRAYGLECLGAAIGGGAASLLPVVGAPGLLGASLAGVVMLAAVAAAARSHRLPAAALLAPILTAAVLAAPLDRALTGWTHPDLLATRDTPHGRLTLDLDQGRLAVFQDDALIHAGEDPGGEVLVHLAATQRDTLDRVLVLGGWLEDLAFQLAPYRPASVVQVEPDPDIVRLVARHRRDHTPPDDLVLADPRAWLPAGRDRFDLIISALPDPVTARANRFWTSRFAALCAARLTDRGVLALRLHTSENVWTPRQARRVASVAQALRDVFADVQVLPGEATILLAGNRPLDRDTARLAARFDRAAPPTRLVSAAWLQWRWTGDRTAETEALLAATRVPANSDLRPVCFGDTLLWDLSRLLPGLGWRAAPRPSRWLVPAMVAAIVGVMALRRRPRAAALLVPGYAGLAAMMLTSAILLHHQTLRGVLYRDLGVLLTVFMLGQAGGAWLGARLAARPAGHWRQPGLLVILSIWSFLTTLGLLTGASLASSVVWLAGAGLVTAIIFAAAAGTPDITLGRLYAADLAGGSLGALLAALLLIPFSGLPATTLTVAALAFPAALAVWPFPTGPGADPN